jgi:hypothetical protein
MKNLKIILTSLSIFAICEPASSLDSYGMNINICTKWATKDNVPDPNSATCQDAALDLPYDCSPREMFDGLWVRYGLSNGAYTGNPIIIPKPKSDSYNCNVSYFSLPQKQDLYIDLFANPWAELFMDELALGPNLDPAEGVIPIKDHLITVKLSNMKSCTIEIEYLAGQYLPVDASDEAILKERRITTDCLQKPDATVRNAICPMVEDLEYEPASANNGGINIIKGKYKKYESSYTFKDEQGKFMFNPLIDKSDLIFSGIELDLDKDNSNKRVMHCYYHFLNHLQYGKLELKQKFDRITVDNFIQDVVPVDPLSWVKTDDANYGSLALPTYIYPLQLKSETATKLEVENYTVLVFKHS